MEAQAEAIFVKWGLDFAIIGETTDTLRFVVKHHGEVMADLPIKELGDEAPLYDRPHLQNAYQPAIGPESIAPPVGAAEAVRRLVASADGCSKRWVWEQYDHLILGNTVQAPGGDAAIVRVLDGPKGLALTTDVTPRYCEADPVEGGKQAVAEAWRNITAVGGLPLAITDNLNFGNPERPEVMGTFVGCIRGIGEACRALDFPVVSGNVSLYNETNGQGILPTPTIGGVGLLDDVTVHATVRFKREGDAILLIGATAGWLGQSLYLKEILGREEGAPPPVDLGRRAPERRFRAPAHPLAPGRHGARLLRRRLRNSARRDGHGGRDRGRDRRARGRAPPRLPLRRGPGPLRAGRGRRPCPRHPLRGRGARHPGALIGAVGGSSLIWPDGTSISVAELKAAHEGWLPAYMAGQAA
jgi:phosphoribosylformylglycinamidine synthase